MSLLTKTLKRITPLLLICIYLSYYTFMFFTAPDDRHGFLFIGGVFGIFIILVLLLLDYLMWKVTRWKWYWLWLAQIIMIAVGYFAVAGLGSFWLFED